LGGVLCLGFHRFFWAVLRRHTELAALLSQLEPSARKKMLREVARDVRRIPRRHRMGTAPRNRPQQKGRIRRGMFSKLKTAKYLKAQAGADSAEVAFVPGVQKLARVHHYGLRDRVSRRGPMVKYAERPLIGLDNSAFESIKK
jgi:phage virion morphogenesis protein